MTLYNIIDILKKIGLQQPNIRTAEEGSVYDIMNANPSVKYNAFVISQQNHRKSEQFAYYTFNLFVVDRLVDDLESNRTQAQSSAIETLSNIIYTLENVYDVEIESNMNFTTFTQKFKDECAGAYLQVTFICEKEIYCSDGEYYDDSPAVEIINQNKDITITENGNYSITYDNGYTGLKEVNIDVEVDTTDAYNEGKADGFQEGIEQGKADGIEEGIEQGKVIGREEGIEEGKVIGREEAIESLPSLVIEENGTYEGAYKDIEVNVSAKVNVKDGIYLSRSTFTTIPDGLDFNGVTNMDRMFKDCENLESLPENFPFSTVKTAKSWLENTKNLKHIPSLDTSGLKELEYFWQGLKIDTVPAIDCSNLTPEPYAHMGIFQSSNNLVNVGAFNHLKVSLTYGNCFDKLDKITYESCINILNGLYDFVGNGETPNSNQGQLRVHPNFLDLVGDEISIATSKGWNIYA